MKSDGVKLTISDIPKSTLDTLSRQAAERGISRSEWIRRILSAASESPEEYDRIGREEKMFSYIADVLAQTIQTNQQVQTLLAKEKDTSLPESKKGGR